MTDITVLYFRDLLVARLMLDEFLISHEIPRQSDLFNLKTRVELNSGRVVKGGLFNEKIALLKIPPLYTLPFSGTVQLQECISKLRAAEILDPADPMNKRARYQFYHSRKDMIMNFLHKYSPNDWDNWPLRGAVHTPTHGAPGYVLKAPKYAR